MRVQRLGMDSSTKSPVVVLRERDGDRVVPIWIGPHEASAIATRLAGMKHPRPLTHDLTLDLVRSLGGELQRVDITRVADQTYYAELVVAAAQGGDLLRVDARPSDAIALALRARARIMVASALLEQVTGQLEQAEATDGLPTSATGEPSGAGLSADDSPTGTPGMTPRELEDYLRSLDPEDFGRFTP